MSGSFRGIVCCRDDQGSWKRNESDPIVTEQEYEQVYSVVSAALEHLLGKTQSENDSQRAYVVGDFFGERTQVIQFYDYRQLNADLVRGLQSLLRREGLANWRIAVAADEPEDVIMVYPDAVCTSRRLSDQDLDVEVRAIATHLALLDDCAAAERAERIDRVRPLLRAAYAEAAAHRRIAQMVHVEPGTGATTGQMLMWVMHPMAECVFDLHDMESDPEAYYWEKFLVLADGQLVKTSGKKPEDGFLLALWGFEADDRKSLRFEWRNLTAELYFQSPD